MKNCFGKTSVNSGTSFPQGSSIFESPFADMYFMIGGAGTSFPSPSKMVIVPSAWR